MSPPSPTAALASAVAPSMSGEADLAARANTLPRELSEFLLELSIALHKHAIYPPGHPLLAQTVDAVYDALGTLLEERVALSIGVARRQLIIEGVATDEGHPLLGELAGKLHRHHIGAVKFARGIDRAELSDALSVVGLEPQRDATPLGMQPELLQSRWINVKLFALTYDRLELLDGEDDPSTRSAGLRGGGQAAQLWVGLARAAIAADRGGSSDEVAIEPEAVARAIDQHGREQAYDQVIVGYLLQIAREVKQEGSESTSLQKRISALVGSLQPETLKRLLEMGGDGPQRRRFVLDASQGMSVGAVVELVRAAASAEGQTISHSLVRMLTKLASHATDDHTARGPAADRAFREHVERLVSSWSLDDPNPAMYSAALERIAQKEAAPTADARRASLACEPSRIVAIGLELDDVGERVLRAVATMLDTGTLVQLLDLLDAAPYPKGTLASIVWERIRARDSLRDLLAESRLDHALVRRMVVRTGTAAVVPLLEALDHRPEASLQERLLSYLGLLGPDAAPAIAQHLAAATPSLARELILCLAKLAPSAAPLEVIEFTNHFDPALRREAVRLLAAYPDTRETALMNGVRDTDERVVYTALVAAQSSCPPAVASVIRKRMERDELEDATVRAAAVRAVATVRDDGALEWVLGRVLQTGGLLRRTRLASATPEVLASLSALATHWPDDTRVAPALALARASSSPSVRAAVQRDGSQTVG
ncbi:MAG: hypothetical protein ABI601_09715 [bacterium]